jgi:hypothetical protein
MTPDRFRQIEELYHRAHEASPADRAALLSQTDPELRREVESLLAGQNDRLILDASTRLPADPSMAVPHAGELLGPYRVESKIGEGGMGEVFRAVDTRLGRPVAVKFVRHEFNARFEREARAISSLNHPHICTLYDVGPNYLVMELLEGETIAARLRNGPLPVEQASHYAAQIADALAEAHKQGIVHRDLKPGNIMLTRTGVKILDFGLATLEGDEPLTGGRMVLGTPAYMAPEQREGKPADARTDLYSFGCVFYEMLTGARATPGRKAASSATLEKIVSRCLEADPSRRWQSASDLEGALRAAPHAESNRIRINAAAAILVAVLIGGYFLLHRSPKLTEKDTIVLADFVNTTGDPIFDGTLRQGLAIQLEQSPFLKIMDDGQVRRVLRLMSLPRGGRISNETAHEICVREGAAATIDGTIASLGKDYVIALQAIRCQDGATLAREQIQAGNKEHVLNALGSAATALRGKLGESLSSIQKRNRPLEQATTPSLEALQNYSAGMSAMIGGHFLPAVPLFERAIDIDPNFAMAYYVLGIGFEQAGDTERSAEYAKKAFRLVDRVSEYERVQITAYNYRATGEVDKEIDAWQRGFGDHPRQWVFHNQLSLAYIDLGRYEEGLKEVLKATDWQADVEPPWRRVLDAYICLDRLGEAKEVAEKVRARGLDGPRIHQRFLEMAYVEDDQAAISREIQWFAGKPEEYLSFGLQAASCNVHGQRRESHNLYKRAAEAALRRGLRNAASEFEEADARADALSGDCKSVHRLGRPALALAICGDAAEAEKVAAETSRLFPNGTIWNAVQLPGIRAAIALNRNQPARSVELLASASPYERSYVEALYLRGLAYLSLHKGAEATAEFRKIVDHKGANWGATWVHPNWGQYYSLSWLGVARGSARAGDTANAKMAFRNFFELWKAADPEIAVLKQAKAEYAGLR